MAILIKWPSCWDLRNQHKALREGREQNMQIPSDGNKDKALELKHCERSRAMKWGQRGKNKLDI